MSQGSAGPGRRRLWPPATSCLRKREGGHSGACPQPQHSGAGTLVWHSHPGVLPGVLPRDRSVEAVLCRLGQYQRLSLRVGSSGRVCSESYCGGNSNGFSSPPATQTPVTGPCALGGPSLPSPLSVKRPGLLSPETLLWPTLIFW